MEALESTAKRHMKVLEAFLSQNETEILDDKGNKLGEVKYGKKRCDGNKHL